MGIRIGFAYCEICHHRGGCRAENEPAYCDQCKQDPDAARARYKMTWWNWLQLVICLGVIAASLTTWVILWHRGAPERARQAAIREQQDQRMMAALLETMAKELAREVNQPTPTPYGQ